jgi:hypothetical protein
MLQKLYITSGFLPGAVVGNEKCRLFSEKTQRRTRKSMVTAVVSSRCPFAALLEIHNLDMDPSPSKSLTL